MTRKEGMKLLDGTYLKCTRSFPNKGVVYGKLEWTESGHPWFIFTNGKGGWGIQHTSEKDWAKYEIAPETEYMLAKLEENKMNKSSVELLQEYRSIITEDGFVRNLKSVEENYHVVDSNDFDEFVQSVYGHPYEVIADEAWNNDSNHRFTVEKKPWGNGAMDRFDVGKLEAFIKTGKSFYIANILLRDMCNRDLIEPGKYLIKVFW